MVHHTINYLLITAGLVSFERSFTCVTFEENNKSFASVLS